MITAGRLVGMADIAVLAATGTSGRRVAAALRSRGTACAWPATRPGPRRLARPRDLARPARDEVAQLLGRPARSFADRAVEQAAVGAWS